MFRKLTSSWRAWSTNLRDSLGTGHIEPRSAPDGRPVSVAFGIPAATPRREDPPTAEVVALNDAQRAWMSPAARGGEPADAIEHGV